MFKVHVNALTPNDCTSQNLNHKRDIGRREEEKKDSYFVISDDDLTVIQSVY